jgi:hypothetical protein
MTKAAKIDNNKKQKGSDKINQVLIETVCPFLLEKAWSGMMMRDVVHCQQVVCVKGVFAVRDQIENGSWSHAYFVRGQPPRIARAAAQLSK